MDRFENGLFLEGTQVLVGFNGDQKDTPTTTILYLLVPYFEAHPIGFERQTNGWVLNRDQACHSLFLPPSCFVCQARKAP